MCIATVTKSYLMKNGCISILATKLLNKIWLFLSFDYGELCCICILVIEIFDEVWLQCTLVTKYSYSLH